VQSTSFPSWPCSRLLMQSETWQGRILSQLYGTFLPGSYIGDMLGENGHLDSHSMHVKKIKFWLPANFRSIKKPACLASFFSRNSVFLSQHFSRNSVFQHKPCIFHTSRTGLIRVHLIFFTVSFQTRWRFEQRVEGIENDRNMDWDLYSRSQLVQVKTETMSERNPLQQWKLF